MARSASKSIPSTHALSLYGNAELIIASLTINILGLALPLALLQVYDRILPNQSTGTVLLLAAGVIGAMALEALMRYWRSVSLSSAGARFEAAVGRSAFEHLTRADLLAVSKSSVGDHLDRLNAVTTIRDHYSGQDKISLLDLPFCFLYIFVIYYVAGALAFIPALIVAVAILLYVMVGSDLKGDVANSRRREDTRFSFLVTTLNSLFTIKAASLESGLLQRFHEHQERTMEAARPVDIKSSLLRDIGQTAGQLVTVLVGAIGAYFVIEGSLTVGALAAATLLSGRSVQPLQAWAAYWARAQTVATAKDAIGTLFALPLDARETDKSDETAPVQNPGALTLERVRLRFDGHDEDTLRDIDLDIRPGEVIGVTGRNDSGKSVLLRVMAGHYQPTSGTISLDGRPLTSYSQERLRSLITLLPQDEVVFSGTIMDNLTLFRPYLAPRAIAAAEAVKIKTYIDRTPAGFNTVLGDGPQDTLPRGLAQRVAIARALVIQPRVVLFDEANSAVDFFGDTVIKDLLMTLKGNCTLVLVSHRPSLLELAERTFFMEDGMIELLD